MKKGIYPNMTRVPWLAFFIVAALALIAGGYWYYQSETERIRREKYQEISAVAKLKIGQIEQWRQERLNDLRRASKASFLRDTIGKLLHDKNNAMLEREIRDRLLIEAKEEGYADALLLDTEGRVMISAETDQHPFTASSKQVVEQAITSKAAILSDFYICPRGFIHIDAAIPLFSTDDQPIAVLIFRSNAESYLYPLIQSWPTPSRTAETVLVRREGQEVLFLNDLRHQPKSALSLREPLTRDDLPAVQAALGKQGMFQGIDYRGVEVLADLRPIPDSPWYMITKEDTGEILAEAHYRAWIVVILTVLLIIHAAGATAYAYRYRQVNLYRDLYESEREKRDAYEEFRTTLYSIGDAVISTDTNGVVKQMNPIAERLTGWLESEASGRPLDEVFRIINENSRSHVESPVQRVLREGKVVGLANHTLLIAKDGTEFPILDSGAPIRGEDGSVTGVVLVFRDQTQERAAEREQRESERRYRDLWEKAPVMMVSLDINGHIIFASDYFCEELGYDRGEVLGLTPFEFQTEQSSRYAQSIVFPTFLQTGSIKNAPLEFIKKNGEVINVLLNVTAERDIQGKIVRSRSVFMDISDHKRTESALKKSEVLYRTLFESAGDAIYVLDTEGDGMGRIVSANSAAAEMHGYTEKELLKLRITDLDSSESAAGATARIQQILRGETVREEVIHRKKDGTEFPLEINARLMDLGDHKYILAVDRDITERKRAEEALTESDSQKQAILDGIPANLAFVNENLEIQWVNRAASDSVEKIPSQMVGHKCHEFWGNPGKPCDGCPTMKAFKTKKAEHTTIVSPDGRVWDEGGEPVFDCDGRLMGVVEIALDVTELTQVQSRLENERVRLRTLVQTIPDLVWLKDPDGVYLTCNPRFERFFGAKEAKIVGKTDYDFVDADLADFFREHDRKAMAAGKPSVNEEWVTFADDGHRELLETIKTPMYDSDGTLIGVLGIGRNITEARKAEEAEKRLATAIEQAAEAVLITNADGIIQYVNPALERVTGFNSEELLGNTPRMFKSGEHDTAFYRQLWSTIKEGNIWSGRLVNKRKDGSLFHEEATISPVRSAVGKITNFVAVKRDVTEHLQLSNQLFQAQKMEAVGTLAGGVAHDFNNILQVVLGYSDLILSEELFPERFRDDLEKVNEAARNGADLVSRLLMFSRKSETNPLSINLNRRIEQLQKMLSRTLPKMIDIELVLADDLPSVHADPTQVDQILMNLAVNARDAMPEGGRLTIQTENVTLDEEYAKTHLEAKPGPYVLLSVSDTGQGMDKETVQHIFEPFFTTKGPGEGTGLGLAMVYGIVKQHGGFIRCYSELGHGTTFKMYFPALVSNSEPKSVETRPAPRGGSETILLVDDEESIRDLGARILIKAGYSVITASNGKEALETCHTRGDEISLVILDLIMPEMGGKQCLEEILKLDPKAKVLIASGYSADGRTKDTIEAGAKGFVNKPYNIKLMLQAVRDALDSD